MLKKITINIMIFNLILFYPLCSYAGHAVKMTDAQLDQVYAGGLNLNYDGFLGNMDSIASNLITSDVGITTIEDKQINVNDSQIKISDTTQMPPIDTQKSTISTASDNIDLGAMPFSVLDNPSTDQDAATLLSNLDLPNVDSNITEPTSPTPPSEIQLPESLLTPLGINGITTPGGRIDIMAFESIGELSALDAGSLASNSINITETAQQYLSALNNVNAAGSTVLIQQNFVILIESTVENLNTLNTLNFESFIPIQ